MNEPSYRQDLSVVHHPRLGFHADSFAPGILRPVDRGLAVTVGTAAGQRAA